MEIPQLIELTGWEAGEISKAVNKAALFYVEQTHCFTCEPNSFY